MVMSVDTPEPLEGLRRAGRVVAATIAALHDAVAPGVTTRELDGYHADAASTVAVGEPASRARRLVDCARAALNAGIRAAQPGATLRDVGEAVERVTTARGFSVVRQLTGHGIGRRMHERRTVRTVDGALSAHEEHTIMVSEGGPVVLTAA